MGVALAALVPLIVGAILTWGPKTLTFQAQEILGGSLSFVAVGLVTWMIFWIGKNTRELKGEIEGSLFADSSGWGSSGSPWWRSDAKVWKRRCSCGRRCVPASRAPRCRTELLIAIVLSVLLCQGAVCINFRVFFAVKDFQEAAPRTPKHAYPVPPRCCDRHPDRLHRQPEELHVQCIRFRWSSGDHSHHHRRLVPVLQHLVPLGCDHLHRHQQRFLPDKLEILTEDKLQIVSEQENIGSGITTKMTTAFKEGTYYGTYKPNMVGQLKDITSPWKRRSRSARPTCRPRTRRAPSSSKIIGEEETFSRTDLYDFKANVEDIVKKKDSTLAEKITSQFKTVDELVAEHKSGQTAEGQDTYVDYSTIATVQKDAGETWGYKPNCLTITFGVGKSLFVDSQGRTGSVWPANCRPF